MNREFKFRVFTKQFGYIYFDLNNLNDMKCYTGELEHTTWFKEKEKEFFTGQKDKNDKDIYEGDIAKTQYGRICKVVWDMESSAWALRSHHVNMLYDKRTWYLIEIIGNIYENPELLEDEKKSMNKETVYRMEKYYKLVNPILNLNNYKVTDMEILGEYFLIRLYPKTPNLLPSVEAFPIILLDKLLKERDNIQ
jgi:hypothetical protein